MTEFLDDLFVFAIVVSVVVVLHVVVDFVVSVLMFVVIKNDVIVLEGTLVGQVLMGQALL